jgi:hypothetical protein
MKSKKISKKLTKEWDYEKNLDSPYNINFKSPKKWWICSKGHSYNANFYNRVKGSGCPICNGKIVLEGYNDLLTNNPNLVKDWDFSKNNNIHPNEVTLSSGKKIWWICNNGHSFHSSIDSKSKGKGCPYCAGRKVLIGFNDLKTINAQIAKEWDYKKNIKKPSDFTKYSNSKAWWLCENNHSWQAKINDRSSGTGCPECRLKNKTSYPEQSIFFYISKHFVAINRYKDKERNISEIDIFIPSYSFGIEYDGLYYHKNIEKDLKKRRVIEDNNIFLLSIKESRVNKKDGKNIIYFKIPYSDSELDQLIIKILGIIEDKVNIKLKSILVDTKLNKNLIIESLNNAKINNSLYNNDFLLSAEWDYEKNGNLSPKNIPFHSSTKVWWKCKLGHSFEAKISNRTKLNPTSCPYCANQKIMPNFNDLETINSEGLKFWDYKKNLIKPNQISAGSSKKVWWICDKDHSWNKSPNNQLRFNKCPTCLNKKLLVGFNDLKTIYPDLSKQWNYDKNKLKPEAYISGSSKKVWWTCKNNHSWNASIINRVRGTNCPFCYHDQRNNNKKN